MKWRKTKQNYEGKSRRDYRTDWSFVLFLWHRCWSYHLFPLWSVIVNLDCGLTVSPMATANSSNILASTFYLTGIPGYEEFHHWISIPFCLLFLVGIMGNCTILHIVQTDPRLHEPMYYFLAMLSLTDMGMSLPTMISLFRVLWSIFGEIQFNTCVVQMFLIHTFSFTESSVLLAMALDRYVAICHPLRYATILTPTLITKIGIVACLEVTFLWFHFSPGCPSFPSAILTSFLILTVCTRTWSALLLLTPHLMLFMG